MHDLRSTVAEPPRLCRCSAMVNVRLTRRGRVQARRVLLDPRSVLTYYFQSCNGITTYYLVSADGSRVFTALQDVPEFEYV